MIEQTRGAIRAEGASAAAQEEGTKRILLLLPPFYTPFTPPLGISVLRAHLQRKGHTVKSLDFNTISPIWAVHHEYFAVLQTYEPQHTQHDYTRLWMVFNAHQLMYLNGASEAEIVAALEYLIPLYRIRTDRKIIDELIRKVEDFFRNLKNAFVSLVDFDHYDVVGTSTFTTSLAPSLLLLQQIKEANPRIMTVMGGGVFADDLALGSENLDTLMKYDFIDHSVVGYGEVLFEKLLSGELADKRVLGPSDVPAEADLGMDELPEPVYDDFNLDNYYHLSFEGARSCPFTCAFCSVPAVQGKFRRMTPEIQVKEMTNLASKHGDNTFFMADSLVNPYINSFSKAAIAAGADLRFDAHMRADKLTVNRDFVALWAKSGLYRSRLGLESGSEDVLEAMDKGTSIAHYAKSLQIMANAGIRVATYFIVGFPGETEEDFQSTLDFLRENYRYIYDIEAHPHYYFPKGQVQSGRHTEHSLYPEEITELIKFKQYEIDKGFPSPAERFDRLKRFSKLVDDLGIINIYTLEGRFAAEQRVQRLFPLVEEIYGGTRLQRGPLAPPPAPVPRHGGPWVEEPVGSGDPVPGALCYRLETNKPLDVVLLRRAVEHVVAANDVLRCEADERDSIRALSSPVDLDWVLATREADGPRADGELLGLAREVGAELAPRGGRAFRVAVSRHEAGADVLVLLHRALGDCRSVTLIAEDLFRAYEQLEHDKDVYFLPIARSYSDAARDLSRVDSAHAVTERAQQGAPRAEQASRASIELPRPLTLQFQPVLLEKNDLAIEELIVAALRRCLSRVEGSGPVELTARLEGRTIDAALRRTPGPLSALHAMELEDPPESLEEVIHSTRSGLRALRTGAGGEAPDRSAVRLLLNPEYHAEAAWVGEDLWHARGFLLDDATRPLSHDILVRPVAGAARSWVEVHHRAGDERIERLAGAINDHFVEELQAVLDHVELYSLGQAYWSEELAVGLRCSPLDGYRHGSDASLRSGRVRVRFDQPLETLRAAAPDALARQRFALAAFAATLSKTSGNDDSLVLARLDRPESERAFPLLVSARWNDSFSELCRTVQLKCGLADRYRASLTAGVERFLSDVRLGRGFEVGFISGHPAGSTSVADAFTPFAVELPLVMRVQEASDHLRIELDCDETVLSGDDVSALLECLRQVLVQAAEDPLCPVEDLAAGQGPGATAKIESYSSDEFSF